MNVDTPKYENVSSEASTLSVASDEINAACLKGTAAFEDFPDYDENYHYDHEEEVLEFITTLHTRKLRISDMVEVFVFNNDNEPVTPTVTKIRDVADGTNEASSILQKAECTYGVGPKSRTRESEAALSPKMAKCLSGLVARARAWLLQIHCAVYDAIDEGEN